MPASGASQTICKAKSLRKIWKSSCATKHETVAIMCAGVLPWRCHRALIADALTVRGTEVRHIIGPNTFYEHNLTPRAVVKGKKISYPGPLGGFEAGGP